MLSGLSRFHDPAYALLRIVSGALFSFHGVQKVLGLFTERAQSFGTQLWLGGLIELACGLLLVVGFQTRAAAFLSSGTMAVAYTQFHWKGQLGELLFPALNKGELALVYAFLFLFIATKGGGVWALDKGR